MKMHWIIGLFMQMRFALRSIKAKMTQKMQLENMEKKFDISKDKDHLEYIFTARKLIEGLLKELP